MSRKTIQLFFFLLAITLALWFSSRSGFLFSLRSVTERQSNPVIRLFYETSQVFSGVFSPLIAPWMHERQIDQLERRIQILAKKTVGMSVLQQENDALRKQLSVRDRIKPPVILAHPIGRERYLVLDKGQEDGVVVGQTVVSGDILVGNIVSVTGHTASVLLPTDPKSRIPVRTKQLAHGVVKGAFGRAMILDEVLQEDPLEESDVIFTTGEGGYRQNLAVATILKVNSEVRDVFKQADLEPLLDIRKVTVVFIIAALK